MHTVWNVALHSAQLRHTGTKCIVWKQKQKRFHLLLFHRMVCVIVKRKISNSVICDMQREVCLKRILWTDMNYNRNSTRTTHTYTIFHILILFSLFFLHNLRQFFFIHFSNYYVFAGLETDAETGMAERKKKLNRSLQINKWRKKGSVIQSVHNNNRHLLLCIFGKFPFSQSIC